MKKRTKRWSLSALIFSVGLSLSLVWNDSTEASSTPTVEDTGFIIINKELIKEIGLPMPKSLKDLGKPIYKGYLVIPHIHFSTSGVILEKAIIREYGERQGELLLQKLRENAQVVSNDGEVINKVGSGQVVIGYGVQLQEQLLPVKVGVVYPMECYSLLE